MEQFLKVDGVETVGAMSGGGGMMSMMSGGSDSISVYVLLNEDNKRSNQDIKKEMEEKVKNIESDFYDIILSFGFVLGGLIILAQLFLVFQFIRPFFIKRSG